MRPRGGHSRCALVALLCTAAIAYSAEETPNSRTERLNRAFLAHVQELGPEHALAAGVVVQSWETYRAEMPESFVPDALAVLYPPYRAALAAFDAQDHATAAGLFAPLRAHADPFVAANARYFHARALVEQGLLEEAEAQLPDLTAQQDELAGHTPYAPHLWFILGYCQAGNLRFDEATQTLRALEQTFPDAPEAVRIGTRQLLLELARRERGTLGEAATLMGYAAARLQAADATPRVRQRQEEVLALLDKLIADAEEQERQAAQSRRGGRAAGRAGGTPRAPAELSQLPAAGGPAETGQQHAAPRADPGQMWGRLPPAQREKILQSLRDRFPSRYRQLVEQYYRSLAEEK
jgi:tetratricopeptide (TPR) repeat protein